MFKHYKSKSIIYHLLPDVVRMCEFNLSQTNRVFQKLTPTNILFHIGKHHNALIKKESESIF